MPCALGQAMAQTSDTAKPAQMPGFRLQVHIYDSLSNLALTELRAPDPGPRLPQQGAPPQ